MNLGQEPGFGVVTRLSLGIGLAILGFGLKAFTRPPGPVAVRLASAPRVDTAVSPGRLVYERYGCSLCHGADGEGGFANANAETAGKVPGVIYVAEGYTEAELRKRILDGVATVGKADPKGPRPPFRMPGWAGQMSDQDVSDLVQYLKSLYPKSAEEKW